jgi:NitT/TauT family transport system substrate-binding protein
MRRFAATLSFFAVAVLCWDGRVKAEQTVALQLPWTHQATYGGFYVADKNGDFAAEGLQVQYLEGGPKADPISPVLDGRAQFGVTGAAELLIARASGKPVRAIATIFRRSPVVFVAKAESGIVTPEDFVGKTIRLTSVDDTSFRAMMKFVGIPDDKYRVVNLPSDVKRFADGEADVWSLYVNGLVILLEQADFKLNYIYPDDYGVHFYADTLFTTDDMISSNHDLVLRFLRASLKGWADAVEEPDLVGTLVHAHNPKADPAAEALKMRATQALVNTGEDRIGWMKEERWSQMAKTLDEQGLLPGQVSVRDVFTLRFLREYYGMAE